jgi:hypothetical protein
MLLSESERNHKIDNFLTRKFRQFAMTDSEPTLRSLSTDAGERH